MILMDVDGVLTQGGIIFTGDGADETKAFYSHDGVAVKLARRRGLRVGFITGRKSSTLERHAHELGVEDLYEEASPKTGAWKRALEAHGLEESEAGFIGDDLVDVSVLRRAGFAASVPDARPEILREVHYVASRPGGRGAVAEILYFILKVQGRWENAAEDSR